MMELSLPAAGAAFSEIPASDTGALNVHKSAQEKVSAPSKWILNGPLDLFFVCGGAMWLVVIVCVAAYLCDSGFAYSFTSIVLLGGAFIFADAHNAATIVRFIDEPGLAARHPYVSILMPVLMVPLLLPLLLGSRNCLELGIKLYLIFIAQHVTAQAYGITMIYLRKTGLELSARQVLVIKTAFTAMMISGIALQLSSAASRYMVGVEVRWFDDIVPTSYLFFIGCAAVVASVVMLGMLCRQAHKSGKALHPAVVLLGANTLLLYTIGPALGLFSLVAPAFFHGTQYIAVTTSHNMKSLSIGSSLAAPKVVASKILTGDNVLYWTKIFSLGAVLYIVIPMMLSNFGIAPYKTMAAVFCLVNFHHFAADAVIWRRRNPNLDNQQVVS
jgi:hypothetical protein